MERLLLLRLQAAGCAAQALLNDVPVLQTPAAGGSVCLPVHEYLVEGDNELSLLIDPVVPGGAAAPRLVRAPLHAAKRLLLPRMGQPASELSARSLAEIEWRASEGEVHRPPVALRRTVSLPVKFPRWRWLDAPPIDQPAGVQPLVAGFVQGLAVALSQGQADAYVSAARVRFDDLALAYQQPVAELVSRWRSRIQLLHATGALKLVVPALADVLVRPCANGRLVESVSATGEPALRTEPHDDGSTQAWPMRIAVVDGRCHIVR
jgi:hypothetical protein